MDALTVRRTWTTVVLVAAVTTLVGCGSGQAPAAPGAPSAAPAASAAPAGPSTAAPVPPGRELETFQGALSRRGVEFGADDDETDTYARAICAGLDAQVPLEEMVGAIQTRTGLSPNDTGFVIGAAASSYCPQHLRRLTGG